jgi:acetylornithine deacetylase
MPRGHAITLGQPRSSLGACNSRAVRNIRTKRINSRYSWLEPPRKCPSCTIRQVTTPPPSSPSPLSLDWLHRVNQDRLLADLDALLSIASLGGTTAEVDAQRHLADHWTTEGLDVTSWEIDVARITEASDFPGMEVDRDQALGVIARLPGTGGGRTLLIDGHTDVVPPGDLSAWSGDPFIPRILDMDGRPSVVARGACDMKAGLVAAWEALRIVREAGINLRGDVIVCPVSGEEDGGLGTFAALEQLDTSRIDGCVVPEPTDLDLVLANGGALTFRLRVHGAAIHASRRSEGVSSIEKFIPILNALMQLEETRNANVDPLMQRWPIAYPLSIGTVQSGDWASTVPDLLVAEGRLGVALGESAESARQQLESAVAAACARDPWLRDHPATVEWWGGQFHSGRTEPDAEIITTVRDAHHRATNSSPDTYGAPYGSDLRLLVGKGGIPTVQYGPGDSRVAHAPDEYVAIDDVVTCSAVLADVIVKFCS